MTRSLSDLGKQYGLQVDPRAKIWQISVGEQQRVEILKTLYRGAKVLIMDEPTAVLAPPEIETLFRTLRSLVAEGKSIVFISHKLDEVMEIADRISVLRKGKMTAAGLKPEQTSIPELAQLMVGREVFFQLERAPRQPGETVLEVEDLAAENDNGLPALRGISLHVRAGEIVGLAGVAGNGQSELAEVITGLRPPTAGSILVNGQEVVSAARAKRDKEKTPRRVIDAGVSHIPEDRTHVGSAPNLSVTDNLILKGYRQPPVGRGWAVQHEGGQEDGRRAAHRIRDHRAHRRYAGPLALGRQSAAADPGPRDLVPAEADDRHAADTRPGCWRNRRRAALAVGAARGGGRHLAGLGRIGRAVAA